MQKSCEFEDQNSMSYLKVSKFKEFSVWKFFVSIFTKNIVKEWRKYFTTILFEHAHTI